MYFEMVTIVFVCLVCSGVLILWGQCLCFCFVFVCFAVHMCLPNGNHSCLFVWFVLVFLYCGASRSPEGNSRLLLAMNINIRLRPHHTIVTISKVQLSQFAKPRHTIVTIFKVLLSQVCQAPPHNCHNLQGRNVTIAKPPLTIVPPHDCHKFESPRTPAIVSK